MVNYRKGYFWMYFNLSNIVLSLQIPGGDKHKFQSHLKPFFIPRKSIEFEAILEKYVQFHFETDKYPVLSHTEKLLQSVFYEYIMHNQKIKHKKKLVLIIVHIYIHRKLTIIRCYEIIIIYLIIECITLLYILF